MRFVSFAPSAIVLGCLGLASCISDLPSDGGTDPNAVAPQSIVAPNVAIQDVLLSKIGSGLALRLGDPSVRAWLRFHIDASPGVPPVGQSVLTLSQYPGAHLTSAGSHDFVFQIGGGNP